jgi:cyanobactin maturation PatA/PatG family protease
MSLDAVSQLGECDGRITIGVIDGMPDMASRALRNANLEVHCQMVPDGLDEPDAHGTEICSLLFSVSAPHRGLAEGCCGIALPVFFRSRGGGARSSSQVAIARAITFAAEAGVSIINISAGQLTSTPEVGQHLDNALRLCAQKRILVVAAAGNDGCDCIHVPPAVASVLAVGAMDERGDPLPSSNWGSAYAVNGILAPGSAVATMSINDAPVTRSGTSFAAGVVSAVAARLLSTAVVRSYDTDAIDIREILIDSCDKCDSSTNDNCAVVLAGRLNPVKALQLLHERGAKRRSEAGPVMRRAAPAGIEKSMINPGEGNTMTTDLVLPSGIDDAGPSLPAGNLLMPGAAGESIQSSGPSQSACSCGCGGKDKDDQHHASQSACGCGCGGKDKADPPKPESSSCGCGSKQPPKLVYTIGSLWFDFGSEARYDAIVQRMGDPVAANNPVLLFGFLKENLEYAAGITFIVMQDQIPVYAIYPSGPFALRVYEAILDGLLSAIPEAGVLRRVAIPGFISGTTRLMNGMTLPVIYPDIRGMVQWDLAQFIKDVKDATGAEKVDDEDLINFLVRVYDELRNFGITPGERALNYAATNAFQAASAFVDAAKRKLELYAIRVTKSQICRPDSDCWDVQLHMFDPENDRRSGRVYRFTVDVSEVLPVTIGTIRTYAAPLATLG